MPSFFGEKITLKIVRKGQKGEVEKYMGVIIMIIDHMDEQKSE